jgi:hypothetical protein
MAELDLSSSRMDIPWYLQMAHEHDSIVSFFLLFHGIAFVLVVMAVVAVEAVVVVVVADGAGACYPRHEYPTVIEMRMQPSSSMHSVHEVSLPLLYYVDLFSQAEIHLQSCLI